MARKGAETQRNKEGPHKDAKVQRKNPLRLGDFARRKIRRCGPAMLRARQHRRRDAKK